MLESFNEFTIYRGNNTKSLHSTYVYRYALPFERVQDKVGWTLFFQQYWHHSVTISIAYYLLIRLIEWIMQDRKPFSLKTPLFLWNGSLAVFSIIGFVRFSEDFFYNWWRYGITYSLCHSCNPDSVAAFWSLLFAISKIVELGGEHTAPGQAYITMNYFAHSVMYSYYAMMAYGLRLPRWVAMAVTTVQTVQMFLGVTVSIYVYRLKVFHHIPCQQSMANLYLAFLIYITFAILFIQFFVNAYLKKRSPSKTAVADGKKQQQSEEKQKED